jgi:hypothetical protein
MSCNGVEIIPGQFVSPIHLRLQGAQWFKVAKVDEIFEIFDKVGDVSYRIVAGNTGQGKEHLIRPYLFISLITFCILHNEKLNVLYSSPNIVRVIKSRRMRWAGDVACMGERRAIYRVLVRKPEGKRPLRKFRHRWEDIKIHEVGCGGMGWIKAAQDRDRWKALMNAVRNLCVP